MAEGDCIKPRALEYCPIESQDLMNQIIRDSESQSFRVVRNNGSYSILDNEQNRIIKVVCTNGTKVTIPGLEVGVFFRAELIEEIFLENVNSLFSTLRIRNNLYMLGGGLYRDYYLTVIDSIGTYNIKRNEIFELSNVLLNPIKYFGYGSNMNFKQMQDRGCPKYKFISKAYLEDYKFVYDGFSKKRQCSVANVIYIPGNRVWRGIFKITKELKYF